MNSNPNVNSNPKPKFNFWQFVNEKISGMKAGDAAYRQQSNAVKAVAPVLEAAVISQAEQVAAAKAAGVLPLGGLTEQVLGDLLGGNTTQSATQNTGE